jgi:hypothetical protein
MRLHDWNTVRQDLDFDPDTGETRLLPLSAPRSDTCPELSFSHQRFVVLSRFRVLQAGRVVFSFWYAPVGRLLMEIIDATYDTLDEDHDFLAFVAGNATSVTWQSNVRERWISEPAVRPAHHLMRARSGIRFGKVLHAPITGSARRRAGFVENEQSCHQLPHRAHPPGPLVRGRAGHPQPHDQGYRSPPPQRAVPLDQDAGR